jgi:hypothetical protein
MGLLQTRWLRDQGKFHAENADNAINKCWSLTIEERTDHDCEQKLYAMNE